MKVRAGPKFKRPDRFSLYMCVHPSLLCGGGGDPGSVFGVIARETGNSVLSRRRPRPDYPRYSVAEFHKDGGKNTSPLFPAAHEATRACTWWGKKPAKFRRPTAALQIPPSTRWRRSSSKIGISRQINSWNGTSSAPRRFHRRRARAGVCSRFRTTKTRFRRL